MLSSELMEVSDPQTEETKASAIDAIVVGKVDDSAINHVEVSAEEVTKGNDGGVEKIQDKFYSITSTNAEESTFGAPETDRTEGIEKNGMDVDINTKDNIAEAGEKCEDDTTSESGGKIGDDTISEAPKDPQVTQEAQQFFYDWSVTPKLLCAATEEYASVDGNENFTKGCQWSPDGTCLMVPADDFRIRIYELPRELYSGKVPEELPLQDLKPALSVREGGLVYDSCWYPLMNSWDPATCCFLNTSRESPLHLWDAFTGELRATYRPYNQVDEVEAAISVQFVDEGKEIWCGFKGALRSFDTERPGRQKETISLKKDFPNVSGLVSCIRENPIMPGLIAFGTYSKCVGLYKDGPLCSLKTDSGVTQIEFSPCGTKLYTAVRRNNEFLCWDLRNPGVVLYSLQDRLANTNQRIQFAISTDGSEIVSGGTDGFIKIWKFLETASEEEDISPLSRIRLSNDCINGVNMHKSLPILATSSGQRIYGDEDDDLRKRDSSVRLWYFNK